MKLHKYIYFSVLYNLICYCRQKSYDPSCISRLNIDKVQLLQITVNESFYKRKYSISRTINHEMSTTPTASIDRFTLSAKALYCLWCTSDRRAYEVLTKYEIMIISLSIGHYKSNYIMQKKIGQVTITTDRH